MTTTPHDIKLNGKGYRLAEPGGYKFTESFKSLPVRGRSSSAEFSQADEQSYWGQSDWFGEGQDDWIADGPFFDGYGLDLDTPGQVNVAKQLAQARAASSNGWVMFTIDNTRLVCIGKSTGTSEYFSASTWNTQTNALASGVKPTSWAMLKGKYYVAGDNGKIYETTDGITYTDKGTPGPTTAAYILGACKGKLFVGHLNRLSAWDPTNLWANPTGATEYFSGSIDGTPQLGCRGSGGLFIVTQGPFSIIYWTDGNQLHQLASFDFDFIPRDMIFRNKLIIAGDSNSETNKPGSFWSYSQNQLELMFDFGDSAKDYGIRSVFSDGLKVYWGANNMTGLGVYDETLDMFEDTVMGFYVGSTIDTFTDKIVHGIAQFGGNIYCGIEGQGIYVQTTPGKYRLRSSLFSGQSKNINKHWARAELRHSTLLTGQTVTIKTLKDGVTLDTWGTSSTVGQSSKIIDAPATYKSPMLQYELSGDANGSALAITSLALAFLEASDNPKRAWVITIQLEGSVDNPQQYQDGTDLDRSSVQMKAELDALWNTVTTFEDIDGTAYPRVLVKFPAGQADEIIKDQDQANVLTEIVMAYQLHLTQL